MCDGLYNHYCSKSISTYRSASKTGKKERLVPPFSAQSLQKGTKVIDYQSYKKSEKKTKNIFVKFFNSQLTSLFLVENQKKYSEQLFSNHLLNHPKSKSFRMYYDRGDLPVKMEYLMGGEKVSWLSDINKLDYSIYLPLFFDGLAETKHPYKTYARQGVRDLLNAGGEKISPVIPQLIIPIKSLYLIFN